MDSFKFLKKDQIETPALLIDLDILDENIEIMAGFLQDKKAKLRPHFKSHKCPTIAHRQINAGAKGITCAKLSEAEVLVKAGIKDILIANQVVNPEKIIRLIGLFNTSKPKLIVTVDNIQNIKNLSSVASKIDATIYVLIEVDVGMKRCGVNDSEEVLRLAREIKKSKGLIFEGIQAYEGHLVYSDDINFKREGVKKMVGKIGKIKEFLTENGIQVNEISGAGTGTYFLTGDNTIWTEIQAGSYIFMDTVYKKSAGIKFKNSLTILTTIIHKRPGIAIADVGLKSCSAEQGFPEIKGYSDLNMLGLGEEHTIIEDKNNNLNYLQKIELIPSHCCTTVNLHDDYYCIRNEMLMAIWPIQGRGKSK